MKKLLFLMACSSCFFLFPNQAWQLDAHPTYLTIHHPDQELDRIEAMIIALNQELGVPEDFQHKNWPSSDFDQLSRDQIKTLVAFVKKYPNDERSELFILILKRY